MKRLGPSLIALVTVAGLLTGGQTQAAPAPSTAADLAQATVPAARADYPAPGKPITLIVPYDAGGGTSVAGQKLAALLEKILKTNVQVVHRPGAATQVGLTELARSKPDGYTIGYGGFPAMPVIYSDPDRKAIFNRKSFQPIATHFVGAGVINVLASSPYKTLQELIDVAKAEPGKLKMGTTGLMGPTHLGALLFEKAAGVKFAFVHFNGDAPAATALLGGHVDATPHTLTGIYTHLKSGAVRPLAIMDSEESSFLPGVKTLAAQGYDAQLVNTMSLYAPAGTPPEAVAILTEAVKKAQNDEQHKKEMAELAFTLRYLNPEQLGAFWDQVESQVIPLTQQIRK